MPKYVTIGYGNRAGYDRTPQPLREAAHAHGQTLIGRGALIAMVGAPVQVRNAEGSGVETLNAPYMTTDLPVAGFALIEAESMEDAIRQAALTPCAIAYGVVEVWPLLPSDDKDV